MKLIEYDHKFNTARLRMEFVGKQYTKITPDQMWSLSDLNMDPDTFAEIKDACDNQDAEIYLTQHQDDELIFPGGSAYDFEDRGFVSEPINLAEDKVVMLVGFYAVKYKKISPDITGYLLVTTHDNSGTCTYLLIQV